MSSPRTGLVRLSPTNPDQVSAAARLHSELLPESIAVRLGNHFMTRFFFTKLVEIDRITCDLFVHEGEYVGFIVYTKYPETFIRDGIRRHPLSLFAVLARAFGSSPRRLGALPDLLRNSALLDTGGSSRTGYWLTFGVVEAARRLTIDERGTRISGALVRTMLDAFREARFDGVAGAVNRSNKSAIFFYHACGFTIRDPGSGDDLRIHYDFAQDGPGIEGATRGHP